MKLTAAVYRTGRTILLKEAHSLVAGDLLEPFVLDFSRCGGATPDTDTLTLVLKRSRTGATVLSVPMFSEVPNHRFLRSATLDLSVSAMGDWYAEEAAGPSPSRKCVEGWIEVTDRDGTWVSCPVPVVLRDVTPRGDVTGYYTATQVDALLAMKQGTLSFDQAPSPGSANPVTSGGVFSALAQKADASALASLADAVSALPAKSYVDAQLALKADLSALDGLVTSDGLGEALALKADVSALSLYVPASSMAAYLAPYATSSSVQAEVASAVEGLVTGPQLTAAVSGLVDAPQFATALAAKADLSYVDAALAAKADATDLAAAVAVMVTGSALEAALSGYATSASVSSAISSALSPYATAAALGELEEAVAGKADAADLSSKADASALEALAGAVEGKASEAYVDAALSGYATESSVAELSRTVSEALAGKADSADVVSGLALKADRETTYTKSEVDELVGQGGGSGGGGGGQPGVTFLERAATAVPLSYGGETLAKVVLVARDGTAVKRIVVEGDADPYAGTHVLAAAGSWSSVSTGGGTVSFLTATSSFRFSYGGSSVDVPCALPQSLGTPMSDLADVSPAEGRYDRAVSSGGVVDHVESRVATRVTNELHLEDLLETRLITAQNATSCAGAVRAVTELTAALLGLERTFANKAVVEAALALKAGAFSVEPPLSLEGGVLSVDLSGVGMKLVYEGGGDVPQSVTELVSDGSRRLVTSGAVSTAIGGIEETIGGIEETIGGIEETIGGKMPKLVTEGGVDVGSEVLDEIPPGGSSALATSAAVCSRIAADTALFLKDVKVKVNGATKSALVTDGTAVVDIGAVGGGGGGGASRPFNFIDPSDNSTWALVPGAVNVIGLAGLAGEVHLDLSLRGLQDGSSRGFALSVDNLNGVSDVTVYVDHIYDEGGADAVASTPDGGWAHTLLADALAARGVVGLPVSPGVVMSVPVYECVPGVFTIAENC